MLHFLSLATIVVVQCGHTVIALLHYVVLSILETPIVSLKNTKFRLSS